MGKRHSIIYPLQHGLEEVKAIFSFQNFPADFLDGCQSDKPRIMEAEKRKLGLEENFSDTELDAYKNSILNDSIEQDSILESPVPCMMMINHPVYLLTTILDPRSE